MLHKYPFPLPFYWERGPLPFHSCPRPHPGLLTGVSSLAWANPGDLSSQGAPSLLTCRRHPSKFLSGCGGWTAPLEFHIPWSSAQEHGGFQRADSWLPPPQRSAPLLLILCGASWASLLTCPHLCTVPETGAPLGLGCMSDALASLTQGRGLRRSGRGSGLPDQGLLGLWGPRACPEQGAHIASRDPLSCGERLSPEAKGWMDAISIPHNLLSTYCVPHQPLVDTGDLAGNKTKVPAPTIQWGKQEVNKGNNSY